MKRAILGSLLLHSLPLVLILTLGLGGTGQGNCEGPNCTDKPQQGDGKTGGSGNSQDDLEPGKKIQDKPLEIMQVTPEVQDLIRKQEDQMALEEEQRKKQEEARKKALDECKDFFGGIGVTFDLFDRTISEVHKGYPAERAGIRVGDRLSSIEPIRGEPGTKVEILVIRGEQEILMEITREKICLEEITP